MKYHELLERGEGAFLPNLSIDLVIIGYEDNVLKCLLPQFGDKWLLPGGYIGTQESVDAAVQRILKERLGIEQSHLKFLSVFGDENRAFNSEFKAFFDKLGLTWKQDFWFNNRFVTLAYYSLVRIADTHPIIDELYQGYDWFDFEELPDMWMDHKSIAETARDHLKEYIQQELVVYNLLPKEFTMPELHQLYESILNKKLDRSRFQKKMLAAGLFERLPKVKKDAPGRNPYQYRVKEAPTQLP
ncbi:MAG: NUDIX domain-containing protein [Bacteroidota bacterium]